VNWDFEEDIGQFMQFTRTALNGFELFNFIRLKCGCKLASYDPKLLFVYRRITINWLISFQFTHSSFYFYHICTRLLVFWIWSSIMGAWDPQTLRDPDVPHFLLPKSCISSCSMRVCLHMLSYQCSALITLWLKTGAWHPSLYGQWWTIHISAYVVICQHILMCILKSLGSFIHSDA